MTRPWIRRAIRGRPSAGGRDRLRRGPRREGRSRGARTTRGRPPAWPTCSPHGMRWTASSRPHRLSGATPRSCSTSSATPCGRRRRRAWRIRRSGCSPTAENSGPVRPSGARRPARIRLVGPGDLEVETAGAGVARRRRASSTSSTAAPMTRGCATPTATRPGSTRSCSSRAGGDLFARLLVRGPASPTTS